MASGALYSSDSTMLRQLARCPLRYTFAIRGSNAAAIPSTSLHPPADDDLQIGILDPVTRKPMVKLAIEGVDAEGWYTLGQINVQHRW